MEKLQLGRARTERNEAPAAKTRFRGGQEGAERYDGWTIGQFVDLEGRFMGTQSLRWILGIMGMAKRVWDDIGFMP
jgi:hypothetical protein